MSVVALVESYVPEQAGLRQGLTQLLPTYLPCLPARLPACPLAFSSSLPACSCTNRVADEYFCLPV